MAYIEIYKRTEPDPQKPARIRILGADYECVIDVATAPDGYGGAKHRAMLTVEDHNRQFDEDLWIVEEEDSEKTLETAMVEVEVVKP